MKLVALVKSQPSIVRLLTHLGEPTVAPVLSPARAPPFWQSTVLRRQHLPQQELFEA
jgi:hypothetical protein